MTPGKTILYSLAGSLAANLLVIAAAVAAFLWWWNRPLGEGWNPRGATALDPSYTALWLPLVLLAGGALLVLVVIAIGVWRLRK